MTTPSADSDSPDNIPRSPTREAVECEAGLRRVLAYICARRHRRWITFAMVFLVIYAVFDMLVGTVNIIIIVLPATLGWYDVPNLIEGHTSLSLVLFLARLPLPIALTIVIFVRMRRIYRFG